jgi:hypothetical protein
MHRLLLLHHGVPRAPRLLLGGVDDAHLDVLAVGPEEARGLPPTQLK